MNTIHVKSIDLSPQSVCRKLSPLPNDSDVNKDWTCKDKDQAYKDKDKDDLQGQGLKFGP